jgi:DNA-binding Lrp family transcriptional regulator
MNWLANSFCCIILQKREGFSMREKILAAIDKNSKLTVTDLAVMLGSTEEEVASEIKQMEEETVICGYPTLINWDKVHCERVTALIEVKVTPQRGLGFDKIAERIYQFNEVQSVYLMSGGFDLTVIIEGRTMREVANFVSEKLAPMDAVLSTATHFVLKKYKEHGLPLVQTKTDERMLITP